MYKVMVVEDEMLVRAGIISFVNWNDYQMKVSFEAQNGQIAWDIYRENKTDLILTDIKMPVMDGLDFIGKVRQTDTTTPIVILTCYDEFKLLHKAVRLGVTDYILKHTLNHAEIDALLIKIKRILDEKGTEDSAKNNIFEKDCHAALDAPLREYLFESARESDDDRLNNMLREYYPRASGDHIAGCFLTVNRSQSSACENCGEVAVDEVAGEAVDKAAVEAADGATDEAVSFAEDAGRATSKGLNGIGASVEKILQSVIAGKDDIFYYSLSDTEYLLLFPLLTSEKKQAMTNILTRVQSMLETYLSIRVTRQIYEITDDLSTIKREVIARLDNKRFVDNRFDNKRFVEMRTNDNRLVNIGTEINRSNVDLPVDGRFRKTPEKEYIRMAKYFIAQHYHKQIRVEDIAEYVGYTPNYLSTIFKLETGAAIIDYINFIRITKAKELLINSSMMIYEIADAVGYNNESYFTKIFKKIVNVSPNYYRKNNN